MKQFKYITILILAFSFLFHAPLQVSHLFVQAEEKGEMQMDGGMDHEQDQSCFEHCMGQAAQLTEHPDISIPVVVAVLEIAVDQIDIVLSPYFERPKSQDPPGKQSHILTIQKRE